MNVNAAGLKIIKDSERLELNAYLCPAGVPTIGYGHTGDVQLGTTITEHQADAILGVDLDRFERGVAALTVPANPNANQFSALVSLAFNIGVENLRKSTLLAKFNAGDAAGASGEFAKWCHAAGRVLPGLVKRRAAEAELFSRSP